MQRKKPAAPEGRPSEKKPTAIKTSSIKVKAPAGILSLPASQSKLEKGKANLKKLLKKIEQGDNPYAERSSFRPGQSQHEQLKEEYTTNNVSSAYTTSLENIHTKQQTFATNEENRQECQLKSIWAEEFEEIAARKMKKFKPADIAEKEHTRQRHNKSCSDRYTSHKRLDVVRSAFNSLDSCKSSKSPKPKTQLKPKKKGKKPPVAKKGKTESGKTSLTPSSMNTPRSFRSQSDALKSGPTLLELRSPKRKLEVPYAELFTELSAANVPNNSNHLPEGQRKITEVSDEELECSIVKSKTLKNNSFKKGGSRLAPAVVPMKKGKAEALRCLREQIKNKVDGLYPTLKSNEKKLICAVILIQRLWRQSKVKNIIGQFLTPKNTLPTLPSVVRKPKLLPEVIANPSSDNLSSGQKQTPEKPSEPLRLFLTPSPRQICSPREPPNRYSCTQEASVSSQSSIPSSKQQANILQFVDSYRTMVLDSKRARKGKGDVRAKPNFFSLVSSLSDKCLLGGMYRNIFSFSEGKHDSTQLKLHEKLMIRKGAGSSTAVMEPPQNLIEPPQQICTVLSSERFYTEIKEEEVVLPAKKPEAVLLEVAEPTKTREEQSRELISEQIVTMLINEFLEQFVRESKRSKYRTKTKKLPVIKSSKTTINQYLQGLIEYLMDHHKQEVVSNLNKIIGVNPRTLLKFLRDDFEDNGIQEEEEDEYCKGPVLSKEVFFDYQAKFQKQYFKIGKDEEQQYINFAQGMLKIHNKSLLDCFTQSLDMMRIYGIRGRPYPWQKSFTRIVEVVNESNVLKKMKKAKSIVQELSSYHLGTLDKRMPHRQQIDEQNLLYSLREQFSRDQHEWDLCSEQMLELKLDLAEKVTDWLLDEAIAQLPNIDTGC